MKCWFVGRRVLRSPKRLWCACIFKTKLSKNRFFFYKKCTTSIFDARVDAFRQNRKVCTFKWLFWVLKHIRKDSESPKLPFEGSWIRKHLRKASESPKQLFEGNWICKRLCETSENPKQSFRDLPLKWKFENETSRINCNLTCEFENTRISKPQIQKLYFKSTLI